MTFKGSLTVYVFLLFGIMVAMYLSGYQAPFVEFMGNALGGDFTNSTGVFNSLINSFTNIFTNPGSFVLVGVLVTIITISSLISGGYSAMFAISLFIIVILANILILPVNFIFKENMPYVLKIILASFLNLLLIMSIVSFTRSGE